MFVVSMTASHKGNKPFLSCSHSKAILYNSFVERTCFLLLRFICGITFYGISLASNDLGGDLYGDFALTSIVEFPANVLVVILTNR